MNKKLFSWKALAGLALLVAMGLTSCKQGTEVDPNDPYNTQKPTQPGVTEKGTADLTFTITKAVQLKELWDKYDAAKKTELMKKTAITIDVNFKDFEIVAGETFVLQKYFNTVANSALTVRFNGNFKNADKQDLYLDLSTNLTGALVNVVLPAQAFNLHLNCAGVRTNLTSGGATIGKLYSNADNKKENALSINGGVTVKGIDDTVTGAILVGGGSIEALIGNTTKSIVNKAIVTKKGFKIGSEDVYTSNLIVNAANLFVTTDKDTPLGVITINKNCGIVLPFSGTTATSITGTAAGESKVTLSGKADDLKNIGALKNVEIANNGVAIDVNADIFDGVKISEIANVAAKNVANITFAKNINVNFDANDVVFAFTSVGFGGQIAPTGGIKKEVTPTKTTYQWDINQKIWVKVTAAAPIYAANASDTGVEVSSKVSVSAAGALTDPDNEVGDHKVFTIVTGNSLMLAPENCGFTFDTKCTTGGAAITDANINGIFDLSAYTKTWGIATAPWFTVKVGDDLYTWKKSNLGDYILVK